MSSTTAASNQLKFNLNAVVDNLNLVNVVHKPEPIVIQKLAINSTSYDGRNVPNDFNFKNRNSFEFIDENKLSMYSYLVQRELKTKEWLSKFELDNFEKPTNTKMENIKNDSKKINSNDSQTNLETNKKKNVAFDTNVQTSTNKQVKPPFTTVNKQSNHSSLLQVFSNAKTSDSAELKKCCIDSVKAIEQFLKILSEFKNERLKIVFNDPVEEEKQKRIQLEQIKYLSRSVYNCQNQISSLKSQFNSNQGAEKKTLNKITPIVRLTHTMRQVIKLITSFSEFYPYRPDNNLTSEKLCFHFYKQLHSCIENFSTNIGLILTKNIVSSNEDFNQETVNNTNNTFLNLLNECDQYFVEFTQIDDESKALTKFVPSETKQDGNKQKKSNTLLNVIRTSRTNPVYGQKQNQPKQKSNVNNNNNNSSSTVVVVSSKTAFDKKSEQSTSFSNTRFEISPPRKSEKQTFAKKKIKTARLFPSKTKSKSSKDLGAAKLMEPEKEHANNVELFKNLEPKKSASLEELEPTKDVVIYSQKEFFKPAFVHLSSPKLSKIGYNRSRSAERNSSNERLERYHSSESFIDPNQTYNSYYSEVSPTRIRPKNINFHYSNDYAHDQLSRNFGELKSKYANEIDSLKYDFDKFYVKNKYGLEESQIKKFHPNEQNYPYVKPILKSNNTTQNAKKMITKLDQIKKESDMIRRKYEKITYEKNMIHSFGDENKPRRPYEECYLQDGAIVTQEYESKIDFNKVYKPLRHPTLKQLQKVIDYSEKYDDYNQKTSVTTIGDSKFDDFELFELLSNELFEECFDSVYEELEKINDELASNLVNNEFVTTEISIDQPEQQTTIPPESPKRTRAPSLKTIASKMSNNQINLNNTIYSSFQSFDEDSFTSISN